MLQKVFEDILTVYHADTDAYGVVWHGACIKWFEKGRIECAKLYGLNTFELEQQNILLPVVNMDIRYKSSAVLGEHISIQTQIKEFKRASIIFEHKVFNAQNNKLHILAQTTVVAVNKDGHLYKNLSQIFHIK